MSEPPPGNPREPTRDIDIEEIQPADSSVSNLPRNTLPPPVPSFASIPPALQQSRAKRRPLALSQPPPPKPVMEEKAKLPAHKSDGRLKQILDKAQKDLLTFCERELQQQLPPHRRGRLHYQLGRIYELSKHDLNKALEHYEQALDMIADHLPTLRATRRIYCTRRMHDQAAAVLDKEIEVVGSAQQKGWLCFEKGKLLEDYLNKSDAAREAYQQGLTIDPSNMALLNALRQSLAINEDWQTLEQTYAAIAAQLSDQPVLQAAWLVRRAEIVDARCKQPQLAAEIYLTALRLDPYAPAILPEVKRLLTDQQRWKELSEVLLIEAELSQSADVKLHALHRRARIQYKRLGDQNSAVETLAQALEIDPRYQPVIRQLVYYLEKSGDFAGAVVQMGELARLLTDREEKVEVHFRMAQVFEHRLHNIEQAVENYRQAIEIDPRHQPSLQALRNLYSSAEQWESLVEIYAAEADASTDKHQRAEAHQRIGQIAEERLATPDQAEFHYEQAIAFSPRAEIPFKALVRLYSEGGKYRKLAALYERVLPHEQPQRAIALLFELGHLYEGALAEPKQAEHAYQRILKLDDQHIGAIHALQRVTERSERYEEYVAALHREVALCDDPSRSADLMLRIAEVLDDHLEENEKAVAQLEEIVSDIPSHAGALHRLASIYQRETRWDKLREIYEKQLASLTSKEEAARLLHKIGQLSESTLGQIDSAIEYYQRALGQVEKFHPSIRALERLYAQQQRWQDLASLLQRKIRFATTPAVKAATSHELGVLSEDKLGDKKAAARAYAAAIEYLPSYRQAQVALSRIKAEASDWQGYVEQLRKNRELSKDAELQDELLWQEASSWEHRIGQPRQAMRCYEQLIKKAPDARALIALEEMYGKQRALKQLLLIVELQNRMVQGNAATVGAITELTRIQEQVNPSERLERISYLKRLLEIPTAEFSALEHLENIAIHENDAALLREVESKQAQIADNGELAGVYHTMVGEIAEDESDDLALDAYRRALSYDPANVAAIVGFARVAERHGDPALIAEAARLKARVTSNHEIASQLFFEAGRLHIETLNNRKEAIKDFERALEYWPGQIDAAYALSELLTSPAELPRLITSLSKAAEAASTHEQSAELWLQIAHQFSDIGGQIDDAITAAKKALARVPQHLPALYALAGYFASAQRWPEAIDALDKFIAYADDPLRIISAHLRAAALWEERLKEPSAAIHHLQQALARDPNQTEALNRMSGLLAQIGDLPGAEQAAARLVQGSTEPHSRADALVRLGDLQMQQDLQEKAARAYLEAITFTGSLSTAAQRYQTTVRRTEDYRELADAFVKYLALSEDEENVKSATYVALAEIQQNQLGDLSAAVHTLQQGLAGMPDHVDLRRTLATTLRRSNQFGQAAAELQNLVAADATRSEAWRELALVYQQMGLTERVRYAIEPLVVLDAATTDDHVILKQNPSRPGFAMPQTFSNKVLEHISATQHDAHHAAALLGSLGDALAKIFPPDLEGFSVTSRDKIRAGVGHPLRALADRLAGVFGVEEFDFYIHGVRTRGWAIEMGSPPSILMPPNSHELSPAQQVFILGQAMALLSTQSYPATKLTPRELEVLLASAGRIVSPTFGEGLTNEEFLNDQAKLIHKALPRKMRRDVEEIAAQYVAAAPIDFVFWRQGILQTAIRAGALLSDDLKASVDTLRKYDRELAALIPLDMVRQSASVGDLLHFWICDPAMELRSHLRKPSNE